jgi:hypothetical protein
MKTLRGFAALALAASMVAVGVPAVNANTGSNLTPAAEAAFADVGRCLASGKDKSLSVHYLIDNSGSLEWTDPLEERRGILTGSVSQLGGFAEQGVSVEVSISFFSSSANMILDWVAIESRAVASQIADRLAGNLTNERVTGTTDWEAGLSLAYQELSQRGDSCKMLIWFTDGGINPDGTYESVTQSLSSLCRPGIGYDSLGSGSDFGLMQQFRRANIPVFGVLYNNTEAVRAYVSENFNQPVEEYLAEERWGMSFMQALVEGRGEIPAESFAGRNAAGGNLDCAIVNSQGVAPPEQTNGAFLNAEDPVALAYQFLKLSSQISGGSLSQIRDGKFTVPPGTAKFEVLVAGNNWQLSGPASSNITASNTSPSAAVSPVESAGAAALVVRTVNSPETYGEWSIETFGANAELVIYPGLTFELDRDRASKILSDYPNTISGRITRTAEFAGEPIDLTEFGDYTISLAYLSGDSWLNVDGVTVDSNSRGDFAIENFSPPSGQDLLEVQLTLALGPSFNNVESRFSLEVQDQQTLARAETDNLRLSNLVGPNGLAEGVLMLQGPNLADSSEFCFAAAPERLDDNQTGIEKVDRDSGFSFNFTNSNTGESGNCFTVVRDEQLPVRVTAANPTQAVGEVVSVWTISAETPGIGAKFEAPLRISFDSETESNNAVALGVFLGLLAMGLLLPLAIMWLINLLTTRFLSVEGTTRAVYPVIADLSGATPKFTDARQGKTGSIVVEPRDFTAVQDTESPKTYETGHGSAVARVPAWPLSATWYEWQAPADSRIISVYPSASISSKDLAAKRATEVSPNMANNWALTVADSELLKTDKSAVKANLVVFSAMRSLPDYQALVQKNLAESSLKSQFAAAEEAARKDLETQQVKAEKQKPRKGPETSEPTAVPARASTGAVPPIPSVGGSRPAGPPIPGTAGGSGQPPIPGASPSSTQPPVPGTTRPMPPIPGANPGSTGSGPNSTPPWKPGQ